MSEHTAENDARWAHALIHLANGLGQRVPWANLLDAWPGDATTLRHAVEDLTEAGLIQATTTGFVTLGAPARVIPPGLHRCVGCGLELDGDDPNARCDECAPTTGDAS